VDERRRYELQGEIEGLKKQPPEITGSFQWYVDGINKGKGARFRLARPVIMGLEDAGVLQSTYTHDLGEPEWEIFV
jgi:hypothetical protein